MYYYKFDGDNLTHTLISDEFVNGYIDFGEPIDWTKKRYVGGVLEDIPAPEVVVPEPYVPTAEEVKQSLIYAVQSHLDALARARGYDGILSAVTYAGDSIVSTFDTEGQAYKQWRTQVWAFCYAYLAEVQAGTRAVPTGAELIALLPAPPAVISNNA